MPPEPFFLSLGGVHGLVPKLYNRVTACPSAGNARSECSGFKYVVPAPFLASVKLTGDSHCEELRL